MPLDTSRVTRERDVTGLSHLPSTNLLECVETK